MSGVDKTGKVGGGGEFAKQATSWATPKASELDRGVCPSEMDRRSQALQAQTETWSTPTIPNGGQKTRSGKRSAELLLNGQAEAFSHPVLSAIDGRELSPTTRTLGPRLNPAFACWLMGWPMWWTNPALTSSVQSAMVSYRWLLQSHLSRLLDAPELSRAAA
jgi:hypothetical protein